MNNRGLDSIRDSNVNKKPANIKINLKTRARLSSRINPEKEKITSFSLIYPAWKNRKYNATRRPVKMITGSRKRPFLSIARSVISTTIINSAMTVSGMIYLMLLITSVKVFNQGVFKFLTN